MILETASNRIKYVCLFGYLFIKIGGHLFSFFWEANVFLFLFMISYEKVLYQFLDGFQIPVQCFQNRFQQLIVIW